LLAYLTRGSVLRLSVGNIVTVVLTLLAWAGDPAVAQTPLAGQGRVIAITGSLSVRHASLASRVLAVNGSVGIGDELATDAQSEAVIQSNDGSTVHIFPDSRVIYNEHAAGIGDFPAVCSSAPSKYTSRS
jgi:hypothetical protein